MATPVPDAYYAALGQPIYGGRSAIPAGTGVFINSFAENTIKQRKDNDAHPFTLTGTCTGNPGLIQWRLVDWYTGIPRTTWATLIENPAATWSADIEYPRGGLDKIEIRDGVATGYTSSTTTKTGVGIFIAMYGQSNMANLPGGVYKYPLGDPRALHVNSSNVIARVGNINDTKPAGTEFGESGYGSPSYITNTPNGDGFVYLATLIAQGMDCPVVLVERAVGGQTYAALTKGSTTPANWDNFAAKLVAAGGDFEVAIAHQGESDALSKTAVQWRDGWKVIRNDLMAINGRTSANFRMFFVALGPGSFGGSLEGDFGKMREGARLIAAENACAYLTSAHTSFTGADTVHLSGQAFNDLYRRGAKTILSWLGVGVSGAGPLATSAVRSGLNIDINVQHAGGTALMDGAGGTGTGLTGFQVFDDGAGGAEIAIASTSIPSSTAFRVTMATTPVGPLRISFGMMNCPHNPTLAEGGANATQPRNPAIASRIPCDNVTYYRGGAAGCPLRPFAAMNVT